MALRSIEVQLGERTFLLTALPGTEALTTYHRVLKHALPAFAGLMQSVGKAKSIADVLRGQGVDFEQLSGTLREMFTTLDEAELKRLQDGLLKSAMVRSADGKLLRLLEKDIYDAVFAENIHHVIELMVEAIKLNYSRFFDELRAKATAAAAAREAAAKSGSATTP